MPKLIHEITPGDTNRGFVLFRVFSWIDSFPPEPQLSGVSIVVFKWISPTARRNIEDHA